MIIPLMFGLLSVVFMFVFILVSQAIYIVIHTAIVKHKEALLREEELVKKSTPYKEAILASRLPTPSESMQHAGENAHKNSNQTEKGD